MKSYKSLNIIINFCALWIDLANPKPVPDLEVNPEGCVHSEGIPNIIRSRRSVPDINVEYPSYLKSEGESQPSEEELPDSGKDDDISPFALAGHVNEFFRGNKNKDSHKPPPQRCGYKQDNLVEDKDLVRREALPPDEQIECYKQQNIEPPGNVDESHKPLLRLKDQRPFTNVFQDKQRMLSRPLIYKERETKNQDREDEFEITSLYSDAEKRKKLKKEKSLNIQPKDYNSLDLLSQHSVYKPVGVRPEFPVYDEDIDFHPDPLQGILEDKYWLDPQEQEAVIRKYIDLANNMQPPRVYEKRDAIRREHVPKSVDSREAFRDAEVAEKDCPCREIASCGDCSRGKWRKKTNYSERDVDGTGYGNFGNRKLLSVNFGDISKQGSDGDGGIENEGLHFESENKGYIPQGEKNLFEKDSSEDFENFEVLNINNEEESQVEGEVPSFTSNYFGRKLLSFDDDDDGITEESYVEEDDSYDTEYETTEEAQFKNSRLLHFRRESRNGYENEAGKSDNRRSIIVDNDVSVEGESPKENNYRNPVMLNFPNNSVYEYKLERKKIGDGNTYFKPNAADEFLQMENPLLHKSNFARYYVPNKFGNLFQKTLIKKKPKENPTTIDTDRVFANESNETYIKVSIIMNDTNISVTTDMANLVKNHKRRGQPIFLGGKGRRSYQLPLMKQAPVKKLQGADESGNVNVQDRNNTVNSSSSSNTTTISTNSSVTAANRTVTSSNATITAETTTETVTSTNTTENATTVAENGMTTEKNKKKIEDYDEDTFDAEIANDIVETVIAESQSGSVVGHNLGLCRRNNSISKYAKVSPESEQLLKKVTECILDHIRDRLEGQSCTLLDDDLLQFLKWMVLSGESYKDFLARIRPEYTEFKSEAHDEVGTPPPRATEAPKQVPVSKSTPK